MKSIVKSNTVFTVIDLETSHFHPNCGGMIIEIAAVKIKDGKIIDKRNQLINPERPISAKITEITSITNEMLRGKPVYREVLPGFAKFIEDSVIVAHNAEFDWNRYLLYFFKKLGIFPTNQVVDTIKLSKEFLKPENIGLGKLCASLGIAHANQHRASGDALATAELFLFLKKNYIDNNNEVQLGLSTTVPDKKISPQEVRKISYWEKSIKDKQLKRLYVTLSRATVFYDIPTNAWEAKDTNEPIDFSDVTSQVLKIFNVSTMDEAIHRAIKAWVTVA